MQENVRHAVIRHDEAITFGHVEPLYDAGNLDKIDRSLFLRCNVECGFGGRFGPHIARLHPSLLLGLAATCRISSRAADPIRH
jgi:hypothetical protein